MLGILAQIVQVGEAPVTVDTTSVPVEESVNVLELALKGGIIMIPLLLLSIIAVYIIVERIVIFKKSRFCARTKKGIRAK